MADNPNLARLKAAYQAWNDKKGGSMKEWAELMDDRAASPAYMKTLQGCLLPRTAIPSQECLDYLKGILKEWTMVHFTPEIFVCDGDSIAMFGKCRYISKATGKHVECRVADLWRFNSAGKAVQMTEVFDTAAAAAAATP